MGLGGHDYSHDGGRRFFCCFGGQRYYMACHRVLEGDKYDKESSKLMFHNNPRYRGENFDCEHFVDEKFCLYYKDDCDGMKNWMLFIEKQKDENYFTPVFHRIKCSNFIMENAGNNFFYIKDTHIMFICI